MGVNGTGTRLFVESPSRPPTGVRAPGQWTWFVNGVRLLYVRPPGRA